MSFATAKMLLKEYHIIYKLCPYRQLTSIILWLKKNTLSEKTNKKNIFIENE
jgi:hypothetical protein